MTPDIFSYRRPNKCYVVVYGLQVGDTIYGLMYNILNNVLYQ